MRNRTGPNNSNWKGGRVVDPRGYVLIRVGVGHPLADCRGYAYEHRLVAQEKLGRDLAPGEIAHHDDDNKSNNARDNIIPVAGIAEHFLLHRKTGSKLRLPDEDNPEVACACGCGATFLKFDTDGRPRRFASGHNPHRAPTKDQILSALRDGPRSVRDLYTLIFTSPRAVISCLSKMKRQGLARHLGRGRWTLPERTPNE